MVATAQLNSRQNNIGKKEVKNKLTMVVTKKNPCNNCVFSTISLTYILPGEGCWK